MSAAIPPRPAGPVPQDVKLRTREAQAQAVIAQGERAEDPVATGPYARVLNRARELRRLEIEARLDPANALRGGVIGPSADPSGANRLPGPAMTPEENARRNAASQGHAAAGIARVGAEAALAYGTGGMSLLPRTAATMAGEAVIEPLYGMATRPPGERLEHVVEDVAVGAAVGATSELLLAGLGGAARGTARLGARVVRGAVSPRAKDLERQYVLHATRQAGGQPPASLVTESPFLTTTERFVEQSFGGAPLRELRERNIETMRSRLLEIVEQTPSPQGYDLDAFLQETLDGRLDAARGYAAAYYKTTFDTAAGGGVPGATRFRPKVPSDLAREQLMDARLGFASLQDDTYKNVLTEMMATKGGVTFERMQRWRSQLFAYSQMFDPSGQVKKEAQAQAAKMAHQLTVNMGNAAKAMGKGKEWDAANQIWADEVRGLYTTQMLRRIAKDEPTKVSRALLRSGTGREVEALRRALGINPDGSFRAIAPALTPEAKLAAKQAENDAKEAWRRVQGAHLWNAVIDSSKSTVDYAATLASGAPVRELTPSGDALYAALMSRGDPKGEFVRALYNTPAAAKSFANVAKLADTLRFYQATPEGGGIAMRVIETGALISIPVGAVGGFVFGGQDAASVAAGAAPGVTLALGERMMASLMANPRFVSALENAIRPTPGGRAAQRAALLVAIEVLRDSSVSDEVRAQADRAVSAFSSAIGMSPEAVRKAATGDAAAFVNRAKPTVVDRADVGGVR
jgi:hypothetical protein